MKLLTAGFFLLPVGAPRYGRERFGIGPGGPMDTRALRFNQLLLGNREDDRALEMAGPLPSFCFEEAVSVAITGNPVKIFLDGHPLAMRRSFNVRPGSALTFERIEAGGWTYLGVAGGIEGIANGEVQLKAPRLNDWSAFLPESLYCERSKDEPIRVVAGPEWDWFDTRARRRFFEQSYRVDSTDRLGCRLKGEPVYTRKPKELISSPVSAGVVQITGGGQPVVLMAGRPTIGGYPRIAFLAPTDLSRLAQTAEGQAVRFREITITEAERTYREETEWMARLERVLENQREPLLYSRSVRVNGHPFYVQITPTD
ncbi:MAG TPA: hypothetical protein PLU70_07045 [Thermotogota bacterium]|nr:hypothetical protein [Thermotogota bacterium]NLH20042.1 hypothetical protein [Thermotogaceae bacterium]OQC32395.1 MAG: KipI antagonist [Thermotogota bacterium ADurb.Bin062]HNW47506.1 hypothetical protein [Thermotogota bacterium]HNY83051.1 hypothetical protein [Thermotogota bacterium]